VLTRADLGLLRCPTTGRSLTFEGDWDRGHVRDGALVTPDGVQRWPVRGGLPTLVREDALHWRDRALRYGYDVFSPFHDLACYTLFPVLFDRTEARVRTAYLERLELGALAELPHRPRILEVSIGSGGNVPFVERMLPPDLDADLWGLDLSPGMLAACRRRRLTPSGRKLRLVRGDAHRLPFADHAFDRVFHVGSINGFGDPGRALAEMARVAKPGTPIVVVDEEVDPNGAARLWQRAVMRSFVWFEPAMRAPVDELPAGAEDVLLEFPGTMVYSLRFRVPAT
jgi:SAM-dependent methyltransferase